MTDVLRAYGETSPTVAHSGCGAVWLLAVEQGNNQRLGEAGACQGAILIVVSMTTVLLLPLLLLFEFMFLLLFSAYFFWCRLHIINVVVSDIARCIIQLFPIFSSFLSFPPLPPFVPPFTVVTDVLRAHGHTSETVARQSCGAIWSLAVNDANKRRLGESGACQGMCAHQRDNNLMMSCFLHYVFCYFFMSNIGTKHSFIVSIFLLTGISCFDFHTVSVGLYSHYFMSSDDF